MHAAIPDFPAPESAGWAGVAAKEDGVSAANTRNKTADEENPMLAFLFRLRILVKLATNNASKLAGDNASTCPLQKELQAES